MLRGRRIPPSALRVSKGASYSPPPPPLSSTTASSSSAPSTADLMLTEPVAVAVPEPAPLGLAVAQGRLTDDTGYLLDRYRLPRPRVGLAIAGIATASMDVSDGLVQAALTLAIVATLVVLRRPDGWKV